MPGKTRKRGRRKSIFLCHSSSDKPFVRSLASHLREYDIDVWIDEAEIRVGDSLIEKISSGISRCEYLAAVLSRKSVRSEWVRRELNIALTQEIRGRRVKVLPLVLEKCRMPAFLLDKKYINFSRHYVDGLNEFLSNLGFTIEDDEHRLMRNVVFSGLAKNEFEWDVRSITWLEPRQFQMALQRMKILGIGVFGIEAASPTKGFIDVDVVESKRGRTTTSYGWIEAFIRKHSKNRGVRFSATYDIPKDVVAAFS